MFLQVTRRSTAAAASVVVPSTVVAASTTMFTTNATKRLQRNTTVLAVRHRCFVSCTEDRRPFRLLSIISQRRRTTVHHPLTPNRTTTTTTTIPTNDRLIRQLHHRYLTTSKTTNTTTASTTSTSTTTQPTPNSHSQQQSQQQSASTKKKTKKHPRKRKLLGSHHPSTTIMTTKDKIRLLMDTNQLLPLLPHQQHLGGVLVVAPAKDLLDLAQSRMSYVRNSLYQYWNPDYTNNSHNSHSNHAEVVHNTTTTYSTSSGTATSPPSQVRTYKAGLVIMDTRWWVWNVLFALLPATLITIYCELRGKHLMYAYHHQLEVDQIRQVMGEDEFTIERANAIIAARNQDRDEKEASLLWNGDLDEMAWKWIQHVVWTVYKAGTDIVTQLWNEYYDSPQYNHNTNNNNHDTNDTNNAVDDERHGDTNHHPAVHDNSITNTPTTIPSSTVSSTPSKESTKPKTRVHSVSDHTPISGMTTTEIPPTTTNDDHDTAVHPSIETLLQRIQQMEERIQQQLQQQQQQPQQQPQPVSQPSVPQNGIDSVDRDTVEQDDAEAIRVIAQRMQHMKQSNVQNRFEIDAKQKWNKYIVDVVQNDEANEYTTQDHHHQQQQHGNDVIPTVSIHRNSTSTSASTGNGKHNSIPSSSMSSTPTDATASSMTENVKLLWSRYGTPIFKDVQQRIGWSDTNQDTNSSNLTINDRLSTNAVEHHATPPPPNNVVVNAVDDVLTTPTPNVVNARHDSNTVSSDSNTLEESTKIDPPSPVPPLPWWKFF